MRLVCLELALLKTVQGIVQDNILNKYWSERGQLHMLQDMQYDRYYNAQQISHYTGSVVT